MRMENPATATEATRRSKSATGKMKTKNEKRGAASTRSAKRTTADAPDSGANPQSAHFQLTPLLLIFNGNVAKYKKCRLRNGRRRRQRIKQQVYHNVVFHVMTHNMGKISRKQHSVNFDSSNQFIIMMTCERSSFKRKSISMDYNEMMIQ